MTTGKRKSTTYCQKTPCILKLYTTDGFITPTESVIASFKQKVKISPVCNPKALWEKKSEAPVNSENDD